MLYFVYLFISSNQLHDPSQSINQNTIQAICNHHRETSSRLRHSRQDMIFLSNLTNKILNKTNEKYFLCYRTLFKLLKSNSKYHENLLDLCVYDSSTNTLSLIQNLADQFGYSSIALELDLAKKNIENFNYKYNRYLGFYELSYFEARIFIYVFVYSRPSRLEFETIMRNGLFYTQFNYLIEISKSESIFKDDQSLCLWNKLPVYHVEEMFAKLTIFNNKFYLPVDAYEMLIYFYPSKWWLPNFECLE